MIKYKRKYLNRLVFQGKTVVEIIDKLLLRQIEADNKRFMEIIGEDKATKGSYVDAWQDELRHELRELLTTTKLTKISK